MDPILNPNFLDINNEQNANRIEDEENINIRPNIFEGTQIEQRPIENYDIDDNRDPLFEESNIELEEINTDVRPRESEEININIQQEDIKEEQKIQEENVIPQEENVIPQENVIQQEMQQEEQKVEEEDEKEDVNKEILEEERREKEEEEANNSFNLLRNINRRRKQKEKIRKEKIKQEEKIKRKKEIEPPLEIPQYNLEQPQPQIQYNEPEQQQEQQIQQPQTKYYEPEQQEQQIQIIKPEKILEEGEIPRSVPEIQLDEERMKKEAIDKEKEKKRKERMERKEKKEQQERLMKRIRAISQERGYKDDDENLLSLTLAEYKKQPKIEVKKEKIGEKRERPVIHKNKSKVVKPIRAAKPILIKDPDNKVIKKKIPGLVMTEERRYGPSEPSYTSYSELVREGIINDPDYLEGLKKKKDLNKKKKK